jgi:hypothetical protein
VGLMSGDVGPACTLHTRPYIGPARTPLHTRPDVHAHALWPTCAPRESYRASYISTYTSLYISIHWPTCTPRESYRASYISTYTSFYISIHWPTCMPRESLYTRDHSFTTYTSLYINIYIHILIYISVCYISTYTGPHACRARASISTHTILYIHAQSFTSTCTSLYIYKFLCI